MGRRNGCSSEEFAGGLGRHATGFVLEYGASRSFLRIEEYKSDASQKELRGIVAKLEEVDVAASKVAAAAIQVATAKVRLAKAQEAAGDSAEANDESKTSRGDQILKLVKSGKLDAQLTPHCSNQVSSSLTT